MTMQTISEYAKAQKVATRTVERWLAAGRLPEAVKVNDAWLIPSEATPNGQQLRAERAERAAAAPASNLPAVQTPAALAGLPPGASLADALASLPAFLPLEVAALLLGIPETSVRRHAEDLGAVPYGPRGRLVVPARTVREQAGL